MSNVIGRTLASALSQFRSARQLNSSVSRLSEDEQLRLLKRGVAPETGRNLKDVAAEIWGHTTNPVGPTHRSGEKLLRRPLRGSLYTSWYPPPPSANPENPFKLTPKQQRWQEKLKMLRARGKGPPKKGAGKRSK